jgi:hypothetical protein
MLKRLSAGRLLSSVAPAAGRRGRAGILALAGAAALALVPGAITSTAAQASTRGPFQIRNWASDNQGCVQVVPGDSRDLQVVTGQCYVTSRSLWRFIPQPYGSAYGDVWQIQNVSTGLCMRALANTDFSVVDTIDCTGISNERWSVLQQGVGNGSAILAIRSEISTGGAPCLDIKGGPSSQTTPIDVFHCGNNNHAQEWTIF